MATFQHLIHDPQIMDDRLENTRLNPALGLLIQRRPRGNIVGQKPPLTIRFNDVPQYIEEGPRGCSRCEASSRIKHKYGSRNSYSPSSRRWNTTSVSCSSPNISSSLVISQ